MGKPPISYRNGLRRKEMAVTNPSNTTISTVQLNRNALVAVENGCAPCANGIFLVFKALNQSIPHKKGMKRFLSLDWTIGISPRRRRR
jgi:hypothetical protein